MTTARSAASRRALQALPWLAFAAGALPLLVSTPAPLNDWPSHIARVWIERQMQDGDAFWAAFYHLQGFLLPNAALDVGILGLLHLGLGLQAAATVYLVGCYALFVGGFAQLARQTGARSALTIPLGATCFYALPIVWGFANYTTGLGLMLWALAAWQALRNRPAARLALGIAAACIIAFCHVIAAFLFAGIAGCIDLCSLWRNRRHVLATMAPSVCALLCTAAVVRATPAGSYMRATIRYRVSDSLPGFLIDKAGIFAKALLTSHPGPDVMLALACLAGIVMAWRARARIPTPWLLASIAVATLAILLPDGIGDGSFADARVPPVAAAILLATLSLSALDPRATLMLGALLMARPIWLAWDWRTDGKVIAALQDGFSRLPPHSTLLAVRGTEYEQVPLPLLKWPPLNNSASLAVPFGHFVPSVFALPSQQPLVLDPAWMRWYFYTHAGTPDTMARAEALAHEACRPPTYLYVLYPKDLPPGEVTTLVPGRAALVRMC